MAQTKFKYKIGHYYSLTPREMDVVAQLVKVGIPERTFHRDKSIPLGDGADIPGGRLYLYAQFFASVLNQHITVDQLYEVKPVKPRGTKAIKTGLKAAAFIIAAYVLSACASYEGLSTCSTFKKTPIHARR